MGTLRDEDLKLNIIVNGDKSKKELGELEQGTRKLINRNKELRAEKERLEAAGKKETAEYKQLTAEMKSNNAAIKKNETRMTSLRKEIGVTGLTMRQLRAEQTRLKRLMDTATPGTPQWKKYNAELKKVETQMAKVRDGSKRTKSAMGKLADGFNKYFGMLTAGAASFAGLVMAGRKAVDAFNNFEERVDNLSALTGLEGDQLKWLSDTAKETSISTVEGNVRIKQSADAIVDAYTKVGSQRPELLKNKEALHAVTQDAIILSEAAKTELEPAVAGLTMAMNQLGYESDQSRRIINVMAAGSKEGAADIPYLTEAYEKAGTTARLMGVDVEQLTGVIEAVAPSYSKASMAGNSFDKVMLKMKANNIGYVNGQFDLIAGIDELKQRYASGETAVELFGVEHAKMGEILVANRDEVVRYTEAVTGTGTALEQASKNTDNNAAKLAQAKNRAELMRIELGEKLSPVLTHIVSKGAMFMKVLSGTIDFLSKYGAQVAIVAGAIATYTAAVKIKSKWDQITLAYTKAKMVAEKAYAITSGLVTGKIKIATAVQWLWNTAILANPIMAIVAGVAALAAGVVFLVKRLNQASAAQRALNEVQKEAEKAVASERNEIEQLVRIAKDERFSREEREKAIKRLNEISPEYLGNLSLETINTEKATQSINDYIKAMEEKALVQAIDDKIAKLMEDNANKEIEGTKGKIKWYQALGNAVASGGNVFLATHLNRRSQIKNEERYERDYNESLEALMAKRAEILATGQSADGSTELTDAEKAEIAAAEEEKARKEAADKAAAQRVENAKKALEQLEKNHQAELVELKRQMLEKNETQDWYNNQSLLKELEYLSQKMAFQKAAGEDTLKTEESILDKQLKLREGFQKNIDSINKDIEKLEGETIDLPEIDVESFDEDYQEGLDALDRYKELKEKFKTDEEKESEAFASDLADLDEALELGIVSHEQYEKRKLDITRKYSDKRLEKELKYLEAAGTVVNTFSNLFEAAKQRELAAAGDNAAKREEIEKKYAKKQQKIALAQALINGAKAQLKILAEVPKGDFGIMTAILMAAAAAATAAEIATIKNQQFKSGGFTARDDSDSKPAGVVHTNEWVASAPLLRNPETRRHIDYLENVQRGFYPRFNTTAIAGAVNRGFASGGYTTPPAPGAISTTQADNNPQLEQNTAMMGAMVGLLQKLERDGVRSNINANEVFDKKEKYDDAVRASEY